MTIRRLLITFIAFLSLYMHTNCPAFADAAPQIYYERGVKLAVPESGTEFKLRTEIASYYLYTSVNQRGGDYSSGRNAFAIQRANLIAAGNFEEKRFSYFIKHNFADSESNNHSGVSEDFNIFTGMAADSVLGPNYPTSTENRFLEAWLQWNSPDNTAKIRVGRQKVPFGLQLAMQETELQFINTSLFVQAVQTNFDPSDSKARTLRLSDRQDGVTGHSFVTAGDNWGVGYTTGIFKQSIDGTSYELDNSGGGTDVMLVLGIDFIGGGYDRSFEGDKYYSDAFAWTIGVGGTFSRVRMPTAYRYYPIIPVSSPSEVVYVWNGNVNAGIKYHGFSLQSEFFINYTTPRGNGADNCNVGYYAQAGYFLVPKDHELAFRFSGLALDKDFGSRRESFEYSVIYNYYLAGDFLKFQTGVSYYDLKIPQVGERYVIIRFISGFSGVF